MIKHAILGLTLSMSLTACETIPTNEAIGAAIGGVGGGVLGNILPEKNKELWTLAGVAAGAFVGAKIAKYLNEQEQQQVASTTVSAAESGEPEVWKNEETGNSGSATVTETKTSPSGDTCKTIVQQVSLADGGSESQEVTACKNADGVWSVA